MYPFIRLAYHGFRARSLPPLGLFDVHVSHHICWPWDLDLWNELNNGRTLTLFDLARIPMAQRAGLIAMLRRERWGLTIAGTVVRYRRRVRAFDRLEMQSRVLGWDPRFIYIEQSMWKTNGECSSQAVYRTALTNADGIVPTDRVRAALGLSAETAPDLPDWVQSWIAAEAMRPWPPSRET